MEMSGSYTIAAPRDQVWDALNDADTLKACIPGCESLNKTADNAFEAKVKAKVGPVSATFTGAVTLEDLNPPASYTITGEGKGGVAGFAKGGAKVALEEQGPDSTLLKYDVKAQVGGKLAQIGARLIDGTAKKLADEFFTTFAAIVEGNAQTARGEGDPQGGLHELPHAAHADHDTDHHAPGHHTAGHDDHDQHDDHGHHAPPPGLTDAELNRDVGAGVRWGVWVAGGIAVALLLAAIFGLGGETVPPVPTSH